MNHFSLPVREMLQLCDATPVAWAVFDPDWYLAAYPAVRSAVEDHSPVALRRYYLEHGQKLGHAPNIFFDEAWHLRTYPRVAAAVRDGIVESAFDAYCRQGFHARSPHWLFDEVLYRAKADDLDEMALQAAGIVNGYDHFLRIGQRAFRSGHPLFEPDIYLAQLPSSAAREAATAEPYTHCLRQFASGASEPRTSRYFNLAWYRTVNGDEAGISEPGGALRHYLCNDTPREFNPLPEFSETYYLAQNGDAAAAVNADRYRNGYAHFLDVGLRELRAPNETIDLAAYAAQEVVALDLERGRAPDAFAHFLRFGASMRRPEPQPEASEPLSRASPTGDLMPSLGPSRPTGDQADALFRDRTIALMPAFGWRKRDFTCAGKPDLSVIMVVRDCFAATLGSVASLRQNYAGAMELILVDAGSSDETRQIETYVSGARLLRFDTDTGLTAGWNAAQHFVSADLVLLLDAGVELAPGAVAAAIQRISGDPRIGAVGGKIIRPDGTLREAGIILWRDATASDYLRDASPLAPEANFVRRVDACSCLMLMLRRSLLRQIDGLDTSFAASRYAGIDLCVRIAAAGSHVVYDPAVAVFPTAFRDEAVADARDRVTFQRKHAALLRFRYIADERVQVFARFASQTGKRLLFIEDNLPLRMIGSGFVRSNDILRVMAALGYQVSVLPVLANRFEIAHIHADIPDTVEVLHDLSIADLPALLTRRPGYYDVFWVARAHNLNGVRSALEGTIVGAGRPPMVVLDTEAVAATRDAIRAEILGEEAVELDPAIMREMAHAELCQSIVVVSRHEAARLSALGFPDVAVIGHMRELQPTPREFDRRAGMLFVGAIHQMDSPNYDSLCWFVDEVLPLVEESLGWETRLTVIGFTGQSVDLDRFSNHPRIVLRGAVSQTEPAYNQHRLFVAPTRFAAGTPYKVYEAASYGLPVVATQLLADQMEWTNGEELLTADARDPVGFAERIVTLYRDAGLWTHLRSMALARLGRENSLECYTEAVRAVLGSG